MQWKESTSVPADKSPPQSRRESGATTVHLNLHAQHNSLVEFTFMNKLSSSNELTLVRLNALFEKIADRNAMAIRADKLFRLILKTGGNKVTTERYRRVLDIEQNDSGKIKGRKGIFRIVSRGPFLAMFKHESISFVNSLESAARSLNNKKMRRKKINGEKSSTSTDSRGKEEAMSTRQTIATAPASSFEKSSIENRKVEKPVSLKRKKSEDKTGMIILADKDCCDEMSAVSVSPVNGSDETKTEDGKDIKFHVMESIKESPSKERTLVKSDSVKNILSSSKKSSRRKKKEAQQRSSKKAAKEKSRTCFIESSTCNDRQAQIDVGESGHSRCNSSLESITNIREVMQANASPRGNKRLKTNNHTPMQKSSTEIWTNSRDFVQRPPYGMTSFAPHPYNLHPSMYHFPHGFLYPTSHVPYNHNEVYQDHNTCQSEDELFCGKEKDDCFIFGKLLASFFKKIMGITEQESFLDETNYKFHSQNEIFRHPFSSHNASFMFHPSYNQEDHRVYRPPTHWNPISCDERYADHMWEKNEGRCNHPRDEESFYASSNKYYDFKPSIKLPEPESQYKPSRNDESAKPLVYDCKSDYYASSRDNEGQHQNRGTVINSKIDEPELHTDYKCSKISTYNIPEPLVDKFMTNDSVGQGELCGEKSPPQSDGKGKNEEMIVARPTSEPFVTSDAELLKPSFLDPNQPQTHVCVVEDKKTSEVSRSAEELKLSGKKSTVEGQQKLTSYDKKVEKKLLDTRPKALGRSRSFSDRRSSRDSLGETLSLTRASSIGSAVSSLTDSSDFISERSQTRSNVRYYHYR